MTGRFSTEIFAFFKATSMTLLISVVGIIVILIIADLYFNQ